MHPSQSPQPRSPHSQASSSLLSPSHAPSPAPLPDVFGPRDLLGEGAMLNGERLRLVGGQQGPAVGTVKFEVIRRLGSGGNTALYLGRQVMLKHPPLPIHCGGECAIKCIRKADFDREALAAVMFELGIHQSLPIHPNIVTLHGAFECPTYLLLVLEYVTGPSLLHFIQQHRDHLESSGPSIQFAADPSFTIPGQVWPDPPLFSAPRLRLISSMFAQICGAVATCHAYQVHHRDIKPENFIVADHFVKAADGRQERMLLVKLGNFGLSTTEFDSVEMDCGTPPYMSYECRNWTAPSYRPRAADIWSLGVVLINLLYHANPWTDASSDWYTCGAFSTFRKQPIGFFMRYFAGMTRPVAEHFAGRVFNILEYHLEDSQRISADEFGRWAQNLPSLLRPNSAEKYSNGQISASCVIISPPTPGPHLVEEQIEHPGQSPEDSLSDSEVSSQETLGRSSSSGTTRVHWADMAGERNSPGPHALRQGPTQLVPVTEDQYIENICAWLDRFFHHRKEDYAKFLACRGESAQQLLDLLQDLLDYDLNAGTINRRRIFKALIRLSEDSKLHPKCLDLTGLEQEILVAGGAFSDVYKGLLCGQTVAVKMMRVFVDSDIDALLKEFSREALIWRQLCHPNLLPFFGLYYLHERLCLVSPWMENGHLRDFFKNGSRDADRDRLLSLVLDVALGLSHLHEKGVVHGDLKGQHIHHSFSKGVHW
ncbi:kinase-like domain-containing protein [Roridomyces roridus]|uniref:Kinase-like domain-containing protein n=1 Tax=Roridomyces roridus TaxID=1738132 RepID=A0AAD7B065_9AGAR|nr:kinase-like domain-containing protein [Roridomyces roridus]